MLKIPLFHGPESIAKLQAVRVAMQRVQRFLEASESDADAHRVEHITAMGPDRGHASDTRAPVRLQLRDASFAWNAEALDMLGRGRYSGEAGSSETGAQRAFRLHDITLQVRSGELVCVMGGVGHGKSSLLAACVSGEMERTGGRLLLSGDVAYVGQRPWILNATVR